MKKQLLLAVSILLASGYGFAQDSSLHIQALKYSDQPKQARPFPHTEDYYLQKAEHFSTAGSLMLLGGVVLSIGGIITYSNAMHSANSEGLGGLASLANAEGGAVAIGCGVGLIGASIPMFIIAGKNRKKAAAVSGGVGFQPYPSGLHTAPVQTYIPTAGIQVQF